MFGNKALISQYEQRIAELKAAHAAEIGQLSLRLEDMRALIMPRNYSTTIQNLEADGVLSGQQEMIELTEAEQAEYDATISERDRILSGTY